MVQLMKVYRCIRFDYQEGSGFWLTPEVAANNLQQKNKKNKYTSKTGISIEKCFCD